MLNKVLRVNLDYDKFIEIQLADTPLVHVWIEVFNEYKKYIEENNFKDVWFPYPLAGELPHIHGYRSGDFTQAEEIVQKLNYHIDEVNSSIEGKKFPYRGYVGMPWSVTNRIHRCFTTGVTSYRLWEPELTHEDLFLHKKLVYLEGNQIFKNPKYPDEYTVVDFNKFEDNIHGINNQVHVYEGYVYSNRPYFNYGGELVSINGDIGGVKYMPNCNNIVEYLFFEWNKYDPVTLNHKFSFSRRISYDILKSSITNNLLDYDVYLGKSIAGKSYGFAYTEFDDPLQNDITNLDFLDGTIQIYPDKFALNKLFTDSPFSQWLREHELEEAMYMPVPIGKIINKNVELKTEVDPSAGHWPSWSPKCKPPYSSAIPELIDI